MGWRQTFGTRHLEKEATCEVGVEEERRFSTESPRFHWVRHKG